MSHPASQTDAPPTLRPDGRSLAALVEAAPLAIFILDGEGRAVHWNQAAARAFSWPGDEAPGRPSLPLGPGRDEDDQALLAQALTGRTILHRREERRLPDGSTQELDVSLAPLRDESGRVSHVAVFAQDVTAFRQAQRALRESEEQAQTLTDLSPDIVLIHLDFHIVLINQAGADLLGAASPQELIGRNILDFFVPEHVPMAKERVRRVLEEGVKVAPLEFKLRRLDGQDVEVEATGKAIKYGGRTAVMSVFRDVTARKRVQEALAQSEERYRSLVEDTAYGFCAIDVATNRFVFINSRICEIFGYSREEGLKATIWDVLAPESLAEARSRFTARAQGDLSEPTVARYLCRRKDGAVFPVEVAASMASHQGRPVIQAVIRDITDQERVQRQLQQAQKMEAVGTLAGGIAHDFNNILQAIQGQTEVLLLGRAESDPVATGLKQIEQAVARASELTQQLLAFGRKAESRRRLVDLNQEVLLLEKLLTRTLPKMIDIQLKLTPKIWAIHADPAQISQIIMNLTVNAKDAMPEGGRLVLETCDLDLDEAYCRAHLGARPGQYVLLSVSDTGMGMNKEVLGRIFEPFFTTKGLGQGTGLGLAMVYGLVKSHDGYITCYSAPQQGTTFKLYFPAVTGQAPAVGTANDDRALELAGAETILVVDDEEKLRLLAEEILTKFGYRVITAAGAEEALEIYRRERKIDLVLLDLIMPGMGGRGCLAGLLALNPQAKILITSGFSPNGTAKNALDSGAAGFISKPYKVQELLTTIRRVLADG